MRKILILFVMLIFAQVTSAEVFNLGVSVEKVPRELYGCWRVQAQLDKTNAPSIFKSKTLDFWELSRLNDVIKLNNPQSGANAEIRVEAVEDKVVVFSKRVPYDNKILTDTVTLRLDENKFSGINALTLESFSLIDNHLMKVETATYHIRGEKISGENVLVE